MSLMTVCCPPPTAISSTYSPLSSTCSIEMESTFFFAVALALAFFDAPLLFFGVVVVSAPVLSVACSYSPSLSLVENPLALILPSPTTRSLLAISAFSGSSPQARCAYKLRSWCTIFSRSYILNMI